MSLATILAPTERRGQSAGDARLHGRGLIIARSLWVFVVLIDLVVLITGLPAFAAQLNSYCTDPTRLNCTTEQLDPAQAAALQHIGLPLTGYAIYAFTLDGVVSLFFIVVGVLIFWHKSQERMGLFVSLLLITFGAFGNDGSHIVSQSDSSLIGLLALPIFFLEWPALGLLFYTFPNGRFVPRWSWLLALLFVVQFGFYNLPYPYNYDNWPLLGQGVEETIVYGSAVGTLLYRYVFVASPAQRQQIKWLAFGFAWTVVVLGAFYSLLPLFFPALRASDSVYQLTLPISDTISYFSIPLGIGIAIMRYRLWDIDTLINKALVYSSLTALLGALYVGLILGLTALASIITGQTSQPVALVIATLAIAALFLPVRRRIQALIDRRFYRKKYDAEKALASFSATLRNEVDLEHVREQLLAVVRETMQPTEVSLWLRPMEQRAALQAAPLEPLWQAQSADI